MFWDPLVELEPGRVGNGKTRRGRGGMGGLDYPEKKLSLTGREHTKPAQPHMTAYGAESSKSHNGRRLVHVRAYKKFAAM